MSRYVTVRLTALEAEKASAAIDYATEWPQCLDPFGHGKDDEDVADKRGIAAAGRASRKIYGALWNLLHGP